MGRLVCVAMWGKSPKKRVLGKAWGESSWSPNQLRSGRPHRELSRRQPDIQVQRSEGRSRLETNLEFTKSRFFNPWEPMKSSREKGGARGEGSKKPSESHEPGSPRSLVFETGLLPASCKLLRPEGGAGRGTRTEEEGCMGS